ncbi:MAG TPA: protein phosphatase 2C domain-containing protein [Streptosporangiaceae bacterium]|nr:protein phosphatase 2C domain-containing protein [Streptosporangiaceae bacterium]
MTTPAAASADQPGRRPFWQVLTASERGASHIAMQTPNQDSVAFERAGSAGMVAAVADGHGHSRHLRSARGSHLAVKIGCQVAQELADMLTAAATFGTDEAPAAPAAVADAITDAVEEFLVPQIVDRWREAVLADVAADPFTEAEDELRQQGDDPTIAYGSTLLLGVEQHDWLILAQIGDGDVVAVRPDGRAIQPVPDDPQLDGLVTTSLCGPEARSDFRVAVVDTTQVPLLAVLLATDGYGNAQVVQEWPSAFSQDLAWMLKQRDVHWLASQLPVWAARCASADGSADDTTVALMLSPSALSALSEQSWPAPAAADLDLGSEETTIPAVPHDQTIPNNLRPPDHPSEPETVRLAPISAANTGADAHGEGAQQGMKIHSDNESHGAGPAGSDGQPSAEPDTNELGPPAGAGER